MVLLTDRPPLNTLFLVEGFWKTSGRAGADSKVFGTGETGDQPAQEHQSKLKDELQYAPGEFESRRLVAERKVQDEGAQSVRQQKKVNRRANPFRHRHGRQPDCFRAYSAERTSIEDTYLLWLQVKFVGVGSTVFRSSRVRGSCDSDVVVRWFVRIGRRI